MNYYPFDSRNPLYKNRIGAAVEGTALTLRLLLHKDAYVSRAFLRIRDDRKNTVDEVELCPKEWLEDYRFYDCEITLREGLYWYSFRYESHFGEFFVTRTGTSLGIVSPDGAWWQQTVYEKDFTTPDWLAGGVIYQIFPDRFYASGKEKTNIPEDRFLCSQWRRVPEYRQNGEKYSLGNDYYGGDIAGICEKLPYLEKLGVTCIYLNPIFEAHSNHRYNTADYMKIDPLLGDEKDLENLCKQAEKHGISVILDGVFSHTGADSIYFNRYGRYGAGGAYNDPDSPYHGWYNFKKFPDEYAAWWDVPSLPETNEENPDFVDFITGDNGVLTKWIKSGIRGWRLDVADELPDSFLDRVRSAVKGARSDAYILGEVWEDASNKISYGTRRRFLRGRQLDSVMNYPFANAIVDFVCGGDAKCLADTVLQICENYPPCCTRLLMNHIGTHDTMRILTRLVRYGAPCGDREWQSRQTLSRDEYAQGVARLKIAAAIQFTLPGVPSVFYGDEAGVQGYGDPFCRMAYPWGDEDKDLVAYYQKLGALRKKCDAFKDGEFVPVVSEGGIFVFERVSDTARALIVVNRTDGEVQYTLPEDYKKATALLGQKPQCGAVSLAAGDVRVLVI